MFKCFCISSFNRLQQDPRTRLTAIEIQLKTIFLSFALIFIAHPVLAAIQDVNVVPPPPPSSPASVQVSGVSDTQAVISWPASVSATQYEVYINGNQYTGSNAPGVTVSGLQPYTNYSVYVIADNAGGSSLSSPTANFKTLPPVPTQPEPLKVSVTDTGAVLTWQPLSPTQFITAYRIYLDGQQFKDVLPQNGVQTFTITTGLSPGNHSVSVSGINANKEGIPSVSTSFIISSLAAPSGVVMTNHSSSSIYLAWQAVPAAQYYLLQLNGITTEQTVATNGEINNLAAGSAYQISVIAVNLDGIQSQPAVIAAATLPAESALSIPGLESQIFLYIPDLKADLISLFAVVAGLSVARILKQPFGGITWLARGRF